jgi:ATP-dependent RNA helicase SUPV3L1/SUV3
VLLQVRQYARLSPLVVSSQALGCLTRLQPGDALVAFSRKSVHGLQREVGRLTGRAACMVGGSVGRSVGWRRRCEGSR